MILSKRPKPQPHDYVVGPKADGQYNQTSLRKWGSEVIDYRYLHLAIEHYADLGYRQIEVPWAVSTEAVGVTLPFQSLPLVTTFGVLVGSAEQAFIQMMLDNTLPMGKCMAVTPCFRVEPKYDALHQPYFMKLELIEYGTNAEVDLKRMVRHALDFFQERRYVRPETQPDGSIDIVTHMGVELGSYGIRKYLTHEWIYGTGIAEPRFSESL